MTRSTKEQVRDSINEKDVGARGKEEAADLAEEIFEMWVKDFEKESGEVQGKIPFRAIIINMLSMGMVPTNLVIENIVKKEKVNL